VPAPELKKPARTLGKPVVEVEQNEPAQGRLAEQRRLAPELGERAPGEAQFARALEEPVRSLKKSAPARPILAAVERLEPSMKKSAEVRVRLAKMQARFEPAEQELVWMLRERLPARSRLVPRAKEPSQAPRVAAWELKEQL